MKKNQLNLLSVAIILLIVSLSFLIYYQYSTNVKREQERYIFENFVNNLQNLQDTINNMQGTHYIKVDIPSGIILYSRDNKLIIQYNNYNYTINFQNKSVILYNNGQNVSFLYPNNYIYLVSTNNTIFISADFNDTIFIFNQYLPNGTIIIISPETNQNNQTNQINNTIDPNSRCLVKYTEQSRFFWGDVNGNNYLPPVGDQGVCGDCWAFASSNQIASIYMIRNNKPNEGLTLSAAYIAIKCNKGYPNTTIYCENNMGCNGGWPYIGILYASQYGIPADPERRHYSSTLAMCRTDDISYPGDVCNFDYNGPTSPLYYSHNVMELVHEGKSLSSLEIIQYLLCYGPLTVSGYMAGIGGSNPNKYPLYFVRTTGHAMLLVGYDTQSQLCQEVYGTPKCWIFANSWGRVTECLIYTSDGRIGGITLSKSECYRYYSDYQACSAAIGSSCGGVYWMQDGYIYVPFDQSPYGISFPKFSIVAIQNVTLAK
jgi:hypothetical protein